MSELNTSTCKRRQKSKNTPININFLYQLIIENDWCCLGNRSTRFLLHNNKINAAEQIIGFGINNGLKYLTEAILFGIIMGIFQWPHQYSNIYRSFVLK